MAPYRWRSAQTRMGGEAGGEEQPVHYLHTGSRVFRQEPPRLLREIDQDGP